MPKPKPKSATSPRSPAKAPHQGWRLGTGLFLACCLAFLLAGGLVWQSLYRPMPNSAQVLRIPEGYTYSALIRDLDQREQIRYPLIVKLYQRWFVSDSLKAGVYQVEAGMSVRALLHHLSDGSMAQMVRVTVIEGTTFKQLRDRLAADEGVTQTLQGVSAAELMARLGSDSTHPEGWFAPETYYFAQGETDFNILKHLYQKQQAILQQEWRNRAADLPYKTAYEALIMASIVEKETGVADERFDVSAVFRNRLKVGMRLQTDPTVIYGMGDAYQGNIRKVDLQTPTPYNTYTINGLPPTPIALPSQASIHATLHPSESDAFYFVATGTGGHQFSRTYAEHQAAVAAYLKVLRSQRAAQTGAN
ncbi:MAG: endolytic transglycosylase MltG [Pseudomonadota bacterium]|nr:endolytic transglycosylase MltG [Pseudomonadota bacterium]